MTMIISCARCGGDHGVVFKELTNPIIVDGSPLTRWAICPETGEPILMRVVETDAPEDPE